MAGHLDKWAGRVAKWLGIIALIFVGIVLLSVLNSPNQGPEPTPVSRASTYTEPTQTPTPTLRPTDTRTAQPPTRTPTPEVVIHVVQKGEWLAKIARWYGVTVEYLVACNNIKNPDLIHPGQKLIISPCPGAGPSSTNIPRPPPPTLPTQTPSLTATPTPTPTNTPRLPSQRPPCRCDGNYYNCDDFGPQADAQACFDYCWRMVGYDVHRLDRDRDRIACEWNP